MRSFGVAATLAALVSSSLAETPVIEIKGSKFFFKNNGTQFYMRGVAYQQEISTNTSATDNIKYTDPLTDTKSCMRDIPYLQQLRTNTIRVYAINPDESHDDCMKALSDAGIYVVADLSEPGTSIIRDDPAWNDDLYTRYTKVIDVMAKYDNTLGFFAGNEVSNQPNNTDASAFVKAAVRDSKAYIKAQNYRAIGVGYATNDDADIRENLANYFNCGDQSDAIDFWGYNIYSWCGDSSFKESGYDVRTKEFESYSVPVFFAEYGCITVQPRKFTDVGTLYGDDMNGVWSGGIVYMYFQEENNYGLVSIDGDSVNTRDDFNYYSSEIASVNPTGVNSNSYTPTNTAPADCPSVGATWAAQATPLPPIANAELCQCMTASLTCAVKSDVDVEEYEDVFGYLCGLSDDACAGIAHNATTGEFGAYSMCNSTEQLSFVMNHYVSNTQNAKCDFDGKAASKQSTSVSDSCGSLLDAAGSDGQNAVTVQPTANPAASQTGGDKGAAAGLSIPRMETFGLMQISMYAVPAILSAIAMVAL